MTKKYKFRWAYSSGLLPGRFKKDDEVNLDRELADAVNRDSQDGKGVGVLGMRVKPMPGQKPSKAAAIESHEMAAKAAAKSGSKPKAPKKAAKSGPQKGSREHELQGMSMPALWALAGELGISRKGKKTALVARILEAEKK